MRIVTYIENRVTILVITILLITALLLLVRATYSPYEQAGPDGLKYERMGYDASKSRNVIGCDNFKHAYWAPAWVSTIALLYRLSDAHPVSIRIFQVTVTFLTSLLIFSIAKRSAGRRAAFFAPLFFVFSTLVFRYTVYYQYEIFLGFLSLSAGALLFSNPGAPDPRHGNSRSCACSGYVKTLIAGTLIGFAALHSPRVLILTVPFGVCLHLKGKRRHLARTLPVFIAGILLILVPWTARNYRCFGEWIPATTNGGINLYIGNNPYSTGGYHMPPEGLRPDHEMHESGKWMRTALAYIIAHPLQTFGRSLKKGLLFWNPHYGDQFILLAAFIAGLIRITKNGGKLFSHDLFWIVATPFAFMAVHMVFFVQPRYFLPAMPCVSVIAGIGIGGAGRFSRAKRGEQQ
jgi:4-amino-4-deoxy-L-arabinose transferase-like glycosyltransferase